MSNDNWQNFLALPDNEKIRQILTTMENIVNEHGRDHRYETRSIDGDKGCFYSWDEEPDCLIAKVLHRLGISMNKLQNLDCANSDDMPIAIGSPIAQEITGLNEQVSGVLATAQRAQDQGFTWGSALDTTMATYSRYL